MKKGIHPEYFEAKVTCIGCGASFNVGSTLAELRPSICSSCHPQYTGKQKVIDSEGRVDRFKRKYAKLQTNVAAS